MADLEEIERGWKRARDQAPLGDTAFAVASRRVSRHTTCREHELVTCSYVDGGAFAAPNLDLNIRDLRTCANDLCGRAVDDIRAALGVGCEFIATNLTD